MKILSTLLLAVLSLALFAACDDDDHRDNNIFIVDGTLVRTPPGGSDFGDVTTFDTLTHTASIVSLQDADGYDFVLDTPSRIVVSAEAAGELNTFLEIYDSFGDLVSSDDDSGVGSDALLVGLLDPGFYTILVWASLESTFHVGDYDLTMLVGDQNGGDFGEIAVNETKSNANNTLASNGGTATWVFTLPEAAEVDIDVIQSSGGALIVLQLINQRDDLIAMTADPGVASPGLQDLQLAAGTYVAVLLNGETEMAGTYEITVSAIAQPAP